jgi:hypothetical protein
VVEDDPSSGWHTYPALPRFGSHYRGLLGRMDVLLETYSYIDFGRRCRVIRAWLEELLRFAAKNAEDLIDVCGAEEQRIIARGRRSDPRDRVGIHYGVPRRDEAGALSFDYPAYALDGDMAEIIAYDVPSIRARKYPGQHEVEYHCPHYRTFVPTLSVTTPAAYLAPKSLAERLEGHGVRFEELTEPKEVEVDSYKVLSKEKTFSPDVAALVPLRGEAEIPLSAKPPPKRFETVVRVSAERHTFTAPAGTLWVPTAQRAGTLAVYLLEPESDDGLTRWEFLDGEIEVGAYHPVHRVVRAISPPKKAE